MKKRLKNTGLSIRPTPNEECTIKNKGEGRPLVKNVNAVKDKKGGRGSQSNVPIRSPVKKEPSARNGVGFQPPAATALNQP